MRKHTLMMAAAILLVLISVVPVLAALDNDWWVMGGGGGSISSAGFALSSTIGQPLIGTASNDSLQLCAGFWCGVMPEYYVYLPLIYIAP
jgi:hypothetical protein